MVGCVLLLSCGVLVGELADGAVGLHVVVSLSSNGGSSGGGGEPFVGGGGWRGGGFDVNCATTIGVEVSNSSFLKHVKL